MSAMLRILKQTLFALILIVGASLATFAQNSNDNKNPPPKEVKPLVPVTPKEKPTPTPTPSEKPKKPLAEISGNGQTIILIVA